MQHYTYPTQYTPQQMSGAVPAIPQQHAGVGVTVCVSCGNHAVAAGTLYCSKRCSWSGESRCPQCGKGRDPTCGFCSKMCSIQGSQANWCPHCGVRQIQQGSTHCSYQCASVGSSVPTSRRHAKPSPHVLLESGDKQLQTLATQFGPQYHILNVIKVNPDSARRKKYLLYRSFVEQVVQASQAGKYGHGGEGNEQRRFFPLRISCAVAQQEGNKHVSTCRTPSHECTTCSVLQNGCSMQHAACGSHFCSNSVSAMVPYCAPNETGVRALMVARTVIGVPQFLQNHNEITFPAEGHHSSVVEHTSSEGGERWDDACVYRDDAVDPQFVVLFQIATPPTTQ